MTLKNLTLTNFEGMKNFELNTDGRSVSVYGDNGTGKTTLADAQAWLLFDRDSAFTAGFLPKPRDVEGAEMHDLIHHRAKFGRLHSRHRTATQC